MFAMFGPNKIEGLRLWLDASDESTIESNNGSVNKWTSKDDNAHEFVQTIVGLQPTTGVATINDKNVLEFENDGLTNTGDAKSVWTFMHDGTKHTVFSVARCTSTSPNYRVLYGTAGASSTNVGQVVFYDNQTHIGRFQRLGAGILRGDSPRVYFMDDAPNYSFTVNQANLIRLEWDPTNTTLGDRLFPAVNGSEITTAKSSGGTSVSTEPLYHFTIGARGDYDSSYFWGGSIAELIVYNRALNPSEVESIEEYLSEKWGIPLL